MITIEQVRMLHTGGVGGGHSTKMAQFLNLLPSAHTWIIKPFWDTEANLAAGLDHVPSAVQRPRGQRDRQVCQREKEKGCFSLTV